MIPLNASDRWYIITLLSLFHSTPLPLLFPTPPIPPPFLSLKQTAFPRTGHNPLSVFISFFLFSFFFNCKCCVTTVNPVFMRMDASRLCYDEVSDQETQFLGTSYKSQSQRSQINPKWKLFSHHSNPQSTQSDGMSIIYHNKHMWDSLILLIEHSMKNYLDDTIHQNFNAQLKKKAYLRCICFQCLIQYVYWIWSVWTLHQSVWSL